MAVAGRAVGSVAGSDSAGDAGAGVAAAPSGREAADQAVSAVRADGDPAMAGGAAGIATPSPSWRSDWPAAIGAAQRPAADADVNRFTIDDVPTPPIPFDTTPPWVHRLGGLTNVRVDPYER